jgi:EAL domain-containing protein (putative c-di-GMP-specific phosphodiesterase class I)
VLAEACRQAQSWRQSGLTDDAFYISINLSSRQLQDPALLDDVTAALRESGLPARAVVLEVTESAVMEDVDVAVARLHALKDLGLRLAVDDFGTGYSSLSYLDRFPVDIVKIDKSFIDGLTSGALGSPLVTAIVNLGSLLGLGVTAEGIERVEQVARLRQMGCARGQGFYFAKPMPARSLAAELAKRVAGTTVQGATVQGATVTGSGTTTIPV